MLDVRGRDLAVGDTVALTGVIMHRGGLLIGFVSAVDHHSCRVNVDLGADMEMVTISNSKVLCRLH